MERGRGGRGRGRGARGRGGDGGRGGRGRGGRGRGGRGGRGGPSDLASLAWDEAIQSIKENKISNLQKILASYPQILNETRKNTSILTEAINEGNVEAINMLLGLENIDINLEVNKRTALDLAAKKNLEEILAILSSKNTKGKPFLSAIEGGHIKLAEQLMKRLYSSPEEAARDHRGDYTLPVHLAGSVECLKLVLPHSDVNAVSYMYGTPLQAAIILKHFDVAEYLVDHVPEVEFEPESWVTSIVGQSPLFLALTGGHRPLVEKLLNSGKCQRTLDSTIGCPTPEEYLGLFDRQHNKANSDEAKAFSTKPPQKVTYVPPKVSKEQYLNGIFQILNVPEEDRVILHDEPTKPQTTEPVEKVDSIFNYAALEECPSSLLRDFLTSRKIEFDPNTLHNELVEKVKTLKLNIENSTPDAQKDEATEILIDRESLKAIPNIIPFDDLRGYFERDGRQRFMRLEIANQKGSHAFLDLKCPGIYSIHRTHFFNQNSLYQSKIVMLMGRPQLDDATHLSEGLAFRLVASIVRDAFDSKVVVEKVEPGVELFYGDVHFDTNGDESDSVGGRIFVNNGRTFVYFSAKYAGHLEKMEVEYGLDDIANIYEGDIRMTFPLPRMPYTFYVGEVKVKPGATDIKEGAVIEGVWWETDLEKYSVTEVFKEENFCRKGKWRIASPFNEAEDGPHNAPEAEVNVEWNGEIDDVDLDYY